MQQADIILNTEYPPMSTARAETQSMFLDTLFSSIERKTRYTTNEQNKKYPWDLHEQKIRQLHILAHTSIMGIASVVEFERRIYTDSHLDEQKVLQHAQEVHTLYKDFSENSLSLLTIPHIYSRDSACSYH